MTKNQVQVGFRDASELAPARIDIAVPIGTKREDLSAILAKVLPELVKLRPRGCHACTSGCDINIRERYEQFLTFDL